MNTTTSKLQPALIGGLTTGVLSALPFVNILNACCCAWVISGGAVAAYLLQQKEPRPIEVGDGAIVGLLAGVIGAAVNLVVSIPVTLLMAPMQRAFLERLIEGGTLPPEFRDMIASGAGTAVGLIIGFFVMLFAGIVFSTIGGILGALIFRKPVAPPPPTVIDVPPPPPPIP